MNWSFAIVNNRLAEIYIERKNGKLKFLGHCYVERSEYKSKEEKNWIKKDTSRVVLTYRNGAYKDKLMQV